MNKKRLILCISLFIAILIVAVFWPEKADEEAMADFVGKWDCQESTREEMDSKDYNYVGYYQLNIETDGTFHLYDAEAGNPGLAGVMYPSVKVGEPQTVRIRCNKEFEPPVVWADMQRDETLGYDFFYYEGKVYLILSYTNEEGETASLYFEEME